MKRIYYTLFLIVLGMAEMNAQRQQSEEGQSRSCLLYTSDAADE